MIWNSGILEIVDSLLLTDESTISRFHCSKKTKDQVPEILDDNDKPKTKKLDPDVDYATFDLREDIVCLNPDAAIVHRPLGIKVEGTNVSEQIHPTPIAGSTSQNGTPGKISSSFLDSLSEGLDKTFGTSTESQSQEIWY